MDKQASMFTLIAAWEESSESQANFCARHGVSLSKFGYWRSKWLAHQSEPAVAPSGSFIPIVKAEHRSSSVEEYYEIIYANGVRLRLPFLDFSVLTQLLCLHV